MGKKANPTVLLERIEALFNEAQDVFRKNKDLANRYVILARKLAMKHRLKIPMKYKRMYCRHCYSFMMPGANARVRNTKKTITYYCEECKRYMRFPKKKII